MVQTFDFEDLDLLDRFAASLRPESETKGENSPTHPYRLYNLLCQAARLYITRAHLSASSSTFIADLEASQFPADVPGSLEDMDFGDSDMMFDPSDWYQGNQQFMSLLDNERMQF